MKILNELKCEKCGKTALGTIHKIWLCGDCIINYENKLKEQMKSFILEE